MHESYAQVYAAAYQSSGEHSGMEARTNPETARENAEAAVFHFRDLMTRLNN